MKYLHIGCTEDVDLTAMKIAGEFVNDGTATFEVKTGAGVVIGSGTLDHVADTDGDYHGVILAAVTETLVKGTPYSVEITFVKGSDRDLRQETRTARFRPYTS